MVHRLSRARLEEETHLPTRDLNLTLPQIDFTPSEIKLKISKHQLLQVIRETITFSNRMLQLQIIMLVKLRGTI